MQGPFLRKYGVETTVDFQLYETDGASFKVDASHASGDSVIMKDEGAEANTDNSFTDEGTGYSIVVTATEMEAARIVIYVADQTSPAVWIDEAIVIETYGNANAMHAFDLDTATQDVNVTTVEGSDATDQIRDAVVDDATRIDASALNTLSGHAPDNTIADVDDVASPDDVWDEAMDTNAPAACNTAREYMNVIVAALAGVSAGTGDWSARDLGNTKTRLEGTLSSTGERNSIDTLDGT